MGIWMVRMSRMDLRLVENGSTEVRKIDVTGTIVVNVDMVY